MPKRPDITRRAELIRLAAHLLWRHIAGRSKQGAGACQLGIGGTGAIALGDARDSEVEQLNEQPTRSCLVEEEVAGLEIAVDDAQRVGLVERSCNLMEDPHDFFGREHAARAQKLVEVTAIEQLHDQKRGSADLCRDVGIRHTYDVFTANPRRGTHLTPESFERLRIAPIDIVLLQQHFQRHPLARMDVLRPIDSPHATAAKQPYDAITRGQDSAGG
ncbi:MAG TPA: hypothetical protein PKI03_20375 [Pseudomonadota bacterium]|nr:hypothetical protein [Pseudomonadota bacterium]